jgi:hypothetical protein
VAAGARAEPGPGAAPGQDQDRARRHAGRGQCQDCGGWFRVAGFGAIESHGGQLLGLAGQCPGSRKEPAAPVACADCWRTGLALQPSSGVCEACAQWRRSGDREAARERLRLIRRGERAEPPPRQDQDQDPAAEDWPGLGECARCGEWFRIVGGGAIEPHDGTRPGRDCPGSGREPVTPVHCADCGMAGKAIQPTTGRCTACARRHREAERAASVAEHEARFRRGEW